MTATSRKLKLPVAMILGAAALMLFVGGTDKAKAIGSQECTAYVLQYTGKVGKVLFPKGDYKLTLEENEKIVCPYALGNFQLFLQNFQGKLKKPWVMQNKTVNEVRTTTFRRGKKSKVAFSITPTVLSSTSARITEDSKCKGNYKFGKATRVGDLKIPKGSYRLTPVNKNRMSCKDAKKTFKRFLKRKNHPDFWKLTKATATFVKKDNRQAGFFITRNYPTPASES